MYFEFMSRKNSAVINRGQAMESTSEVSDLHSKMPSTATIRQKWGVERHSRSLHTLSLLRTKPLTLQSHENTQF